MCMGCFNEYTDAPVVNDRVLAVYDLLANAPGDPDFGFLHVVVGDMNLDDWLFDLDDPDNSWRADEYPKAEQWERAIFDALAALTEAERATAVAMYWGYFGRDGKRPMLKPFAPDDPQFEWTLDDWYAVRGQVPPTRLR